VAESDSSDVTPGSSLAVVCRGQSGQQLGTIASLVGGFDPQRHGVVLEIPVVPGASVCRPEVGENLCKDHRHCTNPLKFTAGPARAMPVEWLHFGLVDTWFSRSEIGDRLLLGSGCPWGPRRPMQKEGGGFAPTSCCASVSGAHGPPRVV
jgi:hypothetical protein